MFKFTQKRGPQNKTNRYHFFTHKTVIQVYENTSMLPYIGKNIGTQAFSSLTDESVSKLVQSL